MPCVQYVCGMASIKRRPGSKYWVACYTLPDGTRKQVSARTEDEYEARVLANRLEQAAQQARRGQLTHQWALRLVNEISGMAGANLLAPDTPRNYIARFREQHKATWSDGTQKKYRVAATYFLASLGPAADESISLLTPRHANRWKDEQLAKGRAPKTAKKDADWLRGVMSTAIDQGLIGENPFDGMKFPSTKAGIARKKKKALSWDQFQRLLAVTDGEWRLLILLAGYTGQRQKDVATLRAGQIDFEQRAIHFRRKKNRDEYMVPMHPVVEAELRKWITDTPFPQSFLMPELANAPATNARSISERFRFEILPLIGIVQPYRKRPPGDNSREVTEYSFHSLRHMLSTELNRAGVSPETRRLIVGHASAQVSAQYTHASLADAARALELLPATQ